VTLIGFLQSFNNVENGFLRRALRSMANLVDQIVVYDDCSTEDVWPLYKEFDCIVIPGRTNSFSREIFHKQELLTWALRYRPDWILWYDTDACLGKSWETREATESFLTQADEQGAQLIALHNLNLWRSNWWYRTDEKFNDLWHMVWWKNSGELHYRPTAGLHQQQFPHFFEDEQKAATSVNFDQPSGQLLHFGFAHEREVMRKYFTYRENGQTGWALERLVNERELVVEPAMSEWFPDWLLEEMGGPEAGPTPKLTPEEMAEYESFEAWEAQCGAP